MKKLNINLNIKKIIIIITAIIAVIALFFIIKNIDKTHEINNNTTVTQSTTEIKTTEEIKETNIKKRTVTETTKTDIKRNEDFYLSVDVFLSVFQERSKFSDTQMSEIKKYNKDIIKMLFENKSENAVSNYSYKKACQYFKPKDTALIKDIAVCPHKNSYYMMCEYKDVKTAYDQFYTAVNNISNEHIRVLDKDTFVMLRTQNLVLFQCNEYFVVIDFTREDRNMSNLFLNQLQIPPLVKNNRS